MKLVGTRFDYVTIVVVVIVVAVVLTPLASATEYVVGDEEGWNTDVDFYAWAAGKTFRVGDTLVFNYNNGDHNVVIVDATGYDKCIASPNSGVLTSGNDRVTLTTTGDQWYICQWHCDYSDQKLMITVIPTKMVGYSLTQPPATEPIGAPW